MHGHGLDDFKPGTPALDDGTPWWRELNRYHWFVLIVAALGWLFDTMDQQLFNLARVPAMRELLAPEKGVSAAPADIDFYGTISTSIFLIGWATGGLGFGILGDRWGRAKVMLLTILFYSLFTGLSALSWDIWSFAVFRFLTGLGVGGEFAVGVSLVAEVMPTRARPFALGLLQALSAVGNITAAIISMILFEMENSGAIGSAWRIMFVIGAVPALLAILIRRNLKEPERWQALSDEELQKKLGSYGELFGHPTWRRNALVGMTLAFAGVVGLWGIGFFSIDLNRSVFRKTFEAQLREKGEAEKDREFVGIVRANPQLLASSEATKGPTVQPDQLLGLTALNTPGNKDAEVLYKTILARIKDKSSLAARDVVEATATAQKPLTSDERARLTEYLAADGGDASAETFKAHAERITTRQKQLNRDLGFWAGMTSIMLNLGAFFGIYGFTYITHFTGRKPAFAVAFVLALLSTVMVFGWLDQFSQIFWMIPIMGFCQLALFGGYAIYFPELFPTHLRSTGTSFCYNVGRFIAATGPLTLGALIKYVFTPDNINAWGLAGSGPPEPMRYAGITMSAIFLLGLLALPFAPETKGKPLPE